MTSNGGSIGPWRSNPATDMAGVSSVASPARFRAALFTFITNRDVPCTNNVCEWALRPSVVFRKVTHGFCSVWDARLCVAVRSVIDTGRLNGLTLLHAVRATQAGHSLAHAT
jgi:transposase